MIYVFLADGFEETEAIAPIDLLRRAGKTVCTVGVTGKVVTGAHGIPVTADLTQDEIQLNDELEMVVLPGGMPGTLNEEASEMVQNAITYCAEQNRYLAAICAAPSILGHRGLLNGKKAVCYPGFEDALTGASVGTEDVVIDDNFITARGAGVAVDFGLALVAVLCGNAVSEQIRLAILYV